MRDASPDEAVPLPIEDALDLHSFHPRDIPDVVREYLACALELGFREVRLIHGRGRGVQRARVRAVAAAVPGVVGLREAPPGRGGWGATIVELSTPTASARSPAP